MKRIVAAALAAAIILPAAAFAARTPRGKAVLSVTPIGRRGQAIGPPIKMHAVPGGWATETGPQSAAAVQALNRDDLPPASPAAGLCQPFAPPCTYCWAYEFKVTKSTYMPWPVNAWSFWNDRGVCQWQGSSMIGAIWMNSMDSSVYNSTPFYWSRDGLPYVIGAYGGVGSTVWDKHDAQAFTYCVFVPWGYSCRPDQRGDLDVWMGGGSPSQIFVFTAAVD
jgi:hypothetical protein